MFKITIMKKTIKPFNVINFEINSSKFEAYNVMPYLVDCYKNEKKNKRPTSFDEFKEFVKSKIPAEDLLGFIHYTTEIMDADRQGRSPYDFSETAVKEVSAIKAVIDGKA